MNLLKFINNLIKMPQMLEEVKNDLDRLKKNIDINVVNQIDEILYSIYFKDSVENESWFNSTGLRLKEWAIGYPAAYLLYNAINIIRPKNILELGLGQSTLITGIYAQRFNANHLCVEHSQEWVSFFFKNNAQKIKNTKIIYKNLKTKIFNEFNVLCYENFKDQIENNKYELIVIDGPFGSDGISRIDVLELVPDILSNQFAIILDDSDREGESRTLSMFGDLLSAHGIKYAIGHYSGKKRTSIICSDNLKFLTSM